MVKLPKILRGFFASLHDFYWREVALLTQNYDEDEKATTSVANLNAAPSVAILMNQSKDASSVDTVSSAVPDSGVTRLIRKSIPDSSSESTNPTPSISEVENDKNCQDSTSSTIIEVRHILHGLQIHY